MHDDEPFVQVRFEPRIESKGNNPIVVGPKPLLDSTYRLSPIIQAILIGIGLTGTLYAQAPNVALLGDSEASPSSTQRPLGLLEPAIDMSRLDGSSAPSARPVVIEAPNLGDPVDASQSSRLPVVAEVRGDLTLAQPTTSEPAQLLRPWWLEAVKQSGQASGIAAELEELIWLAISHSPHVQSVLLEPQILDSQATQKMGVFDPNGFVDSIFKDTSDPVGNSLVTGGPPRLNENLWENRAGVRAKNQYGGQAEFFQEALFKNSNSRFFTPDNQADTKMVLQYTQPLRRGRGREYNRSSFMIATFAANRGRYQASQALQDHAFQITEAYWNLYAARIVAMQVERGIDNLTRLREKLKGRGQIDSLQSQILRADAAIAKQTAALSYALAQVRSNEATLRALIATPELRESAKIIPISETINTPPQIDPVVEGLAALESQPTILQVQEEIKAARTKLRVAQNELQPTLNLVLQGYLHGLKGDYNFGQSLINQVTTAPSYHAGVAYQRPRGNIAAQAIARESRMELRKALFKLDDTLLTVRANVESTAAGVEAAYQQLDSSIRSTLATQSEIEFLEAQWNDAFMAGEVRNGLQLDQLLNAHIQLIASENSWVQAERDYMLALARLALASGRLLPMFPCN